MTKETSKIVEVTPALAMKIMENNSKNRPISDNMVKRYAKIMRQGRWKFNGEPIIVAEDGTLLDGQHRLQAILACGQSQRMAIIGNVPKDAFSTIDIGKKRSAADALATHNREYTKHRAIIAAAITTINHFDKNGMYDDGGRRETMDYADVITFMEKNKSLLKSVDYAMTLSGARKLVPQSCLVALHFLFNKKDPHETENFFNKLNTGENLFKHDPVLMLRNRLIEIRHVGGVFRSREVIPYLIKTWEYVREGKTIERLRINPDYIPVIV